MPASSRSCTSWQAADTYAPSAPVASQGAGGSGSTGAIPRRGANSQSGDTFDGYGGFRNINGDVYGADSERRAAIENTRAAIKALTTEGGGLDMRSKRELYGKLLGQEAELMGMPYGVQNQRDLEGAKMANENRRFDRTELLDREKFGIDRADRIAASNAPPSLKEQLEAARLVQQIQIDKGKALQAGEEGDAKFPGLIDSQIRANAEAAMKAGGVSYEDAYDQASSNMLRANPKARTSSSIAAGQQQSAIDDAMEVFDDNQLFNPANWFNGKRSQNWTGSKLTASDVKDTNAIQRTPTDWKDWLLSGGDDWRLTARDKKGVQHSRTVDDSRIPRRLGSYDRWCARAYVGPWPTRTTSSARSR